MKPGREVNRVNLDQVFLITRLQQAIFDYLHKEKGFSSDMDTITDQIGSHPNQKHIMGGWIKDESVERATKLYKFLSTYPSDKSPSELTQHISLLFTSKKEFPHGLGKSTVLREYICESLGGHFDALIKFDDKWSIHTDRTRVIKRVEPQLFSQSKQLHQLYAQGLCLFSTMKTTQLPLELVRYVFALWMKSCFSLTKSGDAIHNPPVSHFAFTRFFFPAKPNHASYQSSSIEIKEINFDPAK